MLDRKLRHAVRDVTAGLKKALFFGFFGAGLQRFMYFCLPKGAPISTSISCC